MEQPPVVPRDIRFPDCFDDSDCGDGQVCSGGECEPAPPCVSDAECLERGGPPTCVDGVCQHRPCGEGCPEGTYCGADDTCEPNAGGMCDGSGFPAAPPLLLGDDWGAVDLEPLGHARGTWLAISNASSLEAYELVGDGLELAEPFEQLGHDSQGIRRFEGPSGVLRGWVSWGDDVRMRPTSGATEVLDLAGVPDQLDSLSHVWFSHLDGEALVAVAPPNAKGRRAIHLVEHVDGGWRASNREWTLPEQQALSSQSVPIAYCGVELLTQSNDVARLSSDGEVDIVPLAPDLPAPSQPALQAFWTTRTPEPRSHVAVTHDTVLSAYEGPLSQPRIQARFALPPNRNIEHLEILSRSVSGSRSQFRYVLIDEAGQLYVSNGSCWYESFGPGPVHDTAAGDFDGDGNDELIVLGQDGSLTLWAFED